MYVRKDNIKLIKITMIDIKNFKYLNKKSGIYKFTIRKHTYIGSSKNLYNRLKDHLNSLKWGRHHNSTFQNCYNKYGIDAVEYEILELCEQIKLLERESYYINLYTPDINQIQDPINIKMSSISKWRLKVSLKEKYKRVPTWNRRVVYQYDILGNFICKYESITAAYKSTGICPATIKRCILGNSKYQKYIWKYDFLEKCDPLIEDSKAIIQLDNDVTHTYLNIQDAVNNTGLDAYDIYNSCKQYLTLNDIKFRFKKKITNCSLKLRKTIYCYNLEGTFIKSYTYSKEASKELGIDRRTILAACCGKINKSAGGYLWSYIYKPSIPKYENNSSRSRIKQIKLFDLETNSESYYNSLAECIRSFNEINSSSECAVLSHCIKKGYIYKLRYLCAFKEDPYKIRATCKYIYNSVSNTIYKDISSVLNQFPTLSNEIDNYIKQNVEWHFLINSARVKLRESGKLFVEDNPNLSPVEIQEKIND